MEQTANDTISIETILVEKKTKKNRRNKFSKILNLFYVNFNEFH